MSSVKWIPLSHAIKTTGHPNAAALGSWVRRYNAKNPTTPILRRHSYVDLTTLERAITKTTLIATPPLAVMAYVPPIKKRTRRIRPTESAAQSHTKG